MARGGRGPSDCRATNREAIRESVFKTEEKDTPLKEIRANPLARYFVTFTLIVLDLTVPLPNSLGTVRLTWIV